MCVNVCCCLQGEQPPSASVYEVPWPDSRVQIRQTSKQVVVQRCGLTSDRKAAPRPLSHHPSQSQYMWSLKMDAPGIRLQERSTTCDSEHARAFALCLSRAPKSFRGSAETSSPGKPLLKTKNTKNTHAAFCRGRRRAGRTLKIRHARQLWCGTLAEQKISLIS